MHQTLFIKQTGRHHGKETFLAYHNTTTMRHITHRDLMKHFYLPNAYIGQQAPNLTPFDFNQSVVELFRHQNELTHSTQQLNQQITDALENISKSPSFQEKQYFISDILIFKAKDPQSFDDWVEQISKVASLTNKGPYKLALAKSQGSFSQMISSCLPFMGWNKSKEQLCYNFCLGATKQHATSMLIDRHQK